MYSPITSRPDLTVALSDLILFIAGFAHSRARGSGDLAMATLV